MNRGFSGSHLYATIHSDCLYFGQKSNDQELLVPVYERFTLSKNLLNVMCVYDCIVVVPYRFFHSTDDIDRLFVDCFSGNLFYEIVTIS